MRGSHRTWEKARGFSAGPACDAGGARPRGRACYIAVRVRSSSPQTCMLDIVNLALPFFGVIFIGFACARWRRIPDEGLAWMNFFILYVTLPALFFRILSRTPLERLAQTGFIAATTLASAGAFAIAFAIGLVLRRGRADEALLAGVAGGFGNVGYMGPGLALAALGQAAAAPVALIFCFDALLFF